MQTFLSDWPTFLQFIFQSFKLIKVKNLISRVFARYIPAAGTFLLSKVVVEKHSTEGYALFALMISLSAVVPILDLGGGTRAILVSGNASLVSRLLLPPLFLSFLVAVTWLVMPTDITLALVLICIPVTLYIAARGDYARQGVDQYNMRSVRLYPLGLLCTLAILQINALWTLYVAAIFVIYFALIAGLRLDYLKDVFAKSMKYRRWTDIFPKFENLGIVFLSAIAFVGAWGNVSYLSLFGTAEDVKTYDLVWRILSVTFFAQLYLSHSLPEVVQSVEANGNKLNVNILRKYLSLAAALTVVQVGVVAFVFPFYARHFHFHHDWGVVAAGLLMCFVFALIIPINQFLMSASKINVLLYLFGASAMVSVGLKMCVLPSAANALLTTAVGYMIALFGGGWVIHFSALRHGGRREEK